MNETTIVRTEVLETGFGFYTDDELRLLSSCVVNSTLAQDVLGNALTGFGPCQWNILFSSV